MCDDRTNRDIEEYLRRVGVSRRDFNRRGAAAALAMALPVSGHAVDVTGRDVLVPTPDGEADGYFAFPATGAHAAVMLWPSIVGIRETFRALGRKLAESGYAVLVVNPYYRSQAGPVIAEDKGFRDPGMREILMSFARTLSSETSVTDGKAFVNWLDEQPEVDASRKAACIGYCMTGSYGLRIAAAVPERIGAGVSFHGGGLVTAADDSPHLLAPQMEARFLIAIAANDDEQNPAEKDLLKKAFDDAGVSAEIEVYRDTLHGWCVPDSGVYNEAQAERAWSRMLALFETALA
jgi:carboxymethylenebutenolidase